MDASVAPELIASGRCAWIYCIGQRPAHLDAVAPQRARPGESGRIPPSPFEIRYLDPKHRLLYLVRKAA